MGSRLLATSLDQPMAWANHCGPIWLPIAGIICGQLLQMVRELAVPGLLLELASAVAALLVSVLIRHNLRVRYGVPGNLIGDCVCTCCCGSCAACQELRSVPMEGWNLWPELSSGRIDWHLKPFRLLRPQLMM
eukprot:TRINITY_DN4720_c0_g1_i1.p2 TRINITY_DN4720_c0_g1~~TRINITY_DN4720_c0_g1_i1.p2  ORF type:complete len:133 (-),score=23.92 TRINITY_DN4720_c0_g1_i1:44-442(-)